MNGKKYHATNPGEIESQQLVSFSKGLRRWTLLLMHKKSEPSVKSKNKQCKQKSRIQALQGASFLIKKHCKSKHCKSMYRKFSGKTTNIERKNNVCSTHPPESCEVPRCRNDELKSYARKSLNHTHACNDGRTTKEDSIPNLTYNFRL